jgi:hypothetical protein
LRGIDNGVMDSDPVVLYVQGDRPEWRSLSSWPPAASSEVRLDADVGGLRSDDGGSGAIYDPDPRVGP